MSTMRVLLVLSWVALRTPTVLAFFALTILGEVMK